MTGSLEHQSGREGERFRHERVAQHLEALMDAAGALPQRPNVMSETKQAFGLPTDYRHDDGRPLVARIYVGRDVQTEQSERPHRGRLSLLADVAMNRSAPAQVIRERIGHPNQMGVHISVADTGTPQDLRGDVVAEYDWSYNPQPHNQDAQRKSERAIQLIEEVAPHIQFPSIEAA